MKQLIPALAALTASPALAHEISVAHVHGAGGAVYPIAALVGLGVGVALLTRLVRKLRQ